jgi:hypothetical protein
MLLPYCQHKIPPIRHSTPHHTFPHWRCWRLLCCYSPRFPSMPSNNKQHELRVSVHNTTRQSLQPRPHAALRRHILPRPPLTLNSCLHLILPSWTSSRSCSPHPTQPSPSQLNSAAASTPHAYRTSAYTATFTVPHIHAEQRSRADAAEKLHNDLCHPSDHNLCVNLSTGKLPFSTLTCTDVTLNRKLRGPCPHCAAGKHCNPPQHPPSTTPPATTASAVISFDPQILPAPSPCLHTHEIILVDEFTGHLSVVGATSKSTPAIFESLQQVVATTYNSNQHRVQTLHGDSEKINTSLAGPLGSLGITHPQENTQHGLNATF